MGSPPGPATHRGHPIGDAGTYPDGRFPAGVLITAPPGEVKSALPLESEFGVFEAPLEDYDVVELTRFARPLMRGRVAFGDCFAAPVPGAG
ncbi:hypothetical protein [Arthrobacter sp. S2(2024)]|uniref:hypothetical protein n=1 Tax=Arthrobacter sp. S2(2024) TaxID=3111911 RepID=UPI002FC9EF8B